MQNEDQMRAICEQALEKLWSRIERALKSEIESEIDQKLTAHLRILPDMLVEKIAVEHNKGAHGKFTLTGNPNVRAGNLPVPRGDHDDPEPARDNNVVQPDTTDNKVAEVPVPRPLPKHDPPPPPKPQTKREQEDNAKRKSLGKVLPPPLALAAFDGASALRDFKENVLGCNEEGVCTKLTSDPSACFANFVAGPIFSTISSIVILVNTCYIGYQTEDSIQNQFLRLSNEPMNVTSDAGEFFFTIFFMLELAMRMVAQRRLFIFGKDKYWNLFDSILIALSFIQLVASTSINLSVFRIFRIFRLVRLLKVIRKVSLLESLNLMVYGIINCIMPLLWAVLILVIIMYAFGVFFMSGLSGSMEEMSYPPDDEDVMGALDTKFGSVYRTMASLFEGVSGGNDWGGIAEEMRVVSEALYVCFAGYVVFVTLGVLNIVTGFFVDGTMQANVNAREEMLKQAQEKKNTMIQLIGELFIQLDTNNSGTLSYDELEMHLHDEALQDYFCVLEMEPEETKDLFCLLDIRQEGEVSIHDFTNGCLKVMGSPKNLDICTCLYQSKRMMVLLEAIARTLKCK